MEAILSTESCGALSSPLSTTFSGLHIGNLAIHCLPPKTKGLAVAG